MVPCKILHLYLYRPFANIKIEILPNAAKLTHAFLITVCIYIQLQTITYR